MHVALLLPTLENLRYRYLKTKMHRLFEKLIFEHHVSCPHQLDLTNALFSICQADGKTPINKKQLLDEFKTLIITGHETTGSALNWIWYCLQHLPDVKQRLTEEANTFLGTNADTVDYSQLVYTRAVVEEALRLYPPIWSLAHRIKQTAHPLAEYDLPAQSSLLICPYTLHRSAQFWEDPLTFNPDRFLPENRHHAKYTYLPFGAGPRICVANRFAMLQSIVILATIAQQLDINIVNYDAIQPQPLISLRPNPLLQAQIRSVT